MPLLTYHASHEQFPPSRLVELVRRAEAAGFQGVFSSDHYHPWAPSQGHSGFVWSWLGAAMQATSLSFGLITVPGGWRYHPAVLAQAVATLGEMFPDRLPWIAVGSGELVNEHITGGEWPEKPERNERLREGAEVMQALLRGEEVTRRGRITVSEAKLYSLPRRQTRLVGAAVSEATAEWLGGWADGLLTVGHGPDSVRKVVEAFRRGGGEGKPVYFKMDLCWARSEEEALRQAHEQWRFNILGGSVNWDLRTPEEFEAAARFVRPEDCRDAIHVSSDLGRLAGLLAEYAEIGFAGIDLHNVGTDQEAFIDAFGERVLPQFG
ncbi:TIGR03885 family FMN-dependent LLM class oxidoreductase (plasmid) [Skermanella mucosa]|uniref:TIGR03885 family FMN-dependent LLM class oxidoreductase n=1 Tax=Skermanella mucosa TaxID=1789672 RepID=UPI00192C2400|nr:TIGR03885 family FMN-dependent LLM class oxidoreductase [Skermanella mucosa]UEM25077.1 TIGR03885 family FMN-dependent LLM class oxidoreductase [Skermanella mucosa]